MGIAPDLAFADRLRRARRAAGLTQEALAERAGVSARVVSDLERGVIRAPRKDTLELLAGALELAPDERADWERLRRQLARRSDPRPAGAPAEARHPRTNLPVPLTSLIGRQREITELRASLQRPELRLVTLTGAGGIGKTRLGLAVAHALLDTYPDGAFFVSLASVHDPGLVVSAIAQTLDVRETGGQPIVESLTNRLRDKRLLLMLDNFEHVVASATAVAELLSACPRLTILATSRVPLRLSGEHLYPVPPLDLPDATGHMDTAVVGRHDAVTLFVQRSQAARPNFRLMDDNAPVVAEICRRLDGLPLALELAAARMRQMTPQALRDRLEQRLQILTGGPRDAPQRQQTIRDTIVWSFDLLELAQQELFRRLSVFVGGWTIEAAEAVSDLGTATLDGLFALSDASLVVERQLSNGTLRFSMLETIRAFALEQLNESGEEERVRRRHASFFLGLAEALEPLYDGAEQIETLDRLEQEHANLRAALDWFVACSDAEPGLRLAGSLWMFWQLHTHLSEGRRWYDQLLVLPDIGINPRVRAHALTGAGVLAYWQQDHDHAVTRMEEALSIWWDLPAVDQHGLWRALGVLGSIAGHRGDFAAANDRYEELLAHARCIGHARGVRAGLLLLGVASGNSGDLAASAKFFEQSYVLAREAGDHWLLAISTNNLGVILQGQGQFERSGQLLAEAVALHRRLGNKRQLASDLNNLGWTHLYQDRIEAAAGCFEEGLALARESGVRTEIGVALSDLGEVARRMGDLEWADEYCRQGLQIAWSTRDMLRMAQALEGIARLYVDQNELERAVRVCAAATTLRDTIGAPLWPVDQVDFDRTLAELRKRLAEDVFSAAWDAGRETPLEETVADVLGAPDGRAVVEQLDAAPGEPAS